MLKRIFSYLPAMICSLVVFERDASCVHALWTHFGQGEGEFFVSTLGSSFMKLNFTLAL